MKPLQPVISWFEQNHWKPWAFQREAWDAYLQGNSGLVHVPTGSGKTYAALMGPLAELIQAHNEGDAIKGLQVLYITPLKALSRDIEAAIKRPVLELNLPFTVESRTGDSSASSKARQRKTLPTILVTTPESLAILMSYPEARKQFKGLKAVIADEWHELLGTKRGVLLELNLARLRHWQPGLRSWGLSATLGNLEEAAQAIVGVNRPYHTVAAKITRPVQIETVLPETLDSFPWGGHLGIILLDKVVNLLETEGTTLIFTNTRFQAERWFQAILERRPAWAKEVALHHGSLDKEERHFVEAGVKAGDLKAVVCTSSLDLGVDFPAVEQVVQIGSPHGLARLIQRAGRAKHRLGETSTIYCVPTHGLELLEFAALRETYLSQKLESRFRFDKPFDVLSQHILSCALSEPFDAKALHQEVKQACPYKDLTLDEFNWVLALLEHGGSRLQAYPEYHKLAKTAAGYEISNRTTQRLHRMNIGTITSDASLKIKYLKGATLGTVEEWFVSKLSSGDVFTFAGKTLEFIRSEDKVVYVKRSSKPTTTIPRWGGGRLPLSESLGQQLRQLIASEPNTKEAPELTVARPLLEAQQQLSALPGEDELLIELCQTREGHHCWIYPFEGRLVHEGLASLWSNKLAKLEKASFSLSVNDYGLELVTKKNYPFEKYLKQILTSPPGDRTTLIDAIEASLNLNDLAKRQFRDIARITGLVLQNYPGNYKTGNQLQTSASLLYDVFKRYDPDNLLLYQAKKEVLEQLFELDRLERTLQRMKQSRLIILPVKRPTPLGFPLLVERLASKLSTESLAERVAALKATWMKVAS